ncbi:tRNA (adenosine(37)-N6)-threonylcarbamoyltransferase complex dimerization subunit type 1 TsaB [Pseudotabrizicola formosa]|uniref:tRNA (adenosine(37)-N6)-threonylcarbamoyltransferase complex dimerization subunit type 1 TsaB n=1 Tax=Pseudotabrizicola formosa TaxID=2030009 RepID=UPI000CD0FBA8|nr:tRNA (adenosine(37)-N6)-threonylcarbamoyltransferase complex dimerization subunit type 1 TsaB [Pseudotabrizicola formosa]
MPPETILAFDTSAAHCAAALLLADGRCLIRREEMAKGQAERLLPLLEEVLAEANLGWRDLNAIGVGTGPGNFTGVRISVAAARGLALSLGVPAIGVTRLEALAHGLPRPVTVVEDARRDEVYVQHFSVGGPEPAALRALAGLSVAGPVTGSAAGNVEGDAVAPAMPMVEAIARIAASRAQDPQPRPAPFYLRGADAAPPSDPPPVILDA